MKWRPDSDVLGLKEIIRDHPTATSMCPLIFFLLKMSLLKDTSKYIGFL